MTSSHVALFWTNEDCFEVCWAVPYSDSPRIPATRLDPPEGGPEPDGDPWVCEFIAYSPEDHTLRVCGIQEGSILDMRLQERFKLSDGQVWEAIADDCDNRRYAAEAALEDYHERRREEILYG